MKLKKVKELKHKNFTTGGCMQRWFRLSSLLLVLTTAFNVALSTSYVEVRGSIPPGSVRGHTPERVAFAPASIC